MLLAGARFFKPAVFNGLDSWHGRMALGKSFRLWSHFPSKKSSIGSGTHTCSGKPRMCRLLLSIGCGGFHFGSTSLQENFYRQVFYSYQFRSEAARSSYGRPPIAEEQAFGPALSGGGYEYKGAGSAEDRAD